MKEVKVRVPGWAGSLARYKRTQEFHMKYLKNGKRPGVKFVQSNSSSKSKSKSRRRKTSRRKTRSRR